MTDLGPDDRPRLSFDRAERWGLIYRAADGYRCTPHGRTLGTCRRCKVIILAPEPVRSRSIAPGQAVL